MFSESSFKLPPRFLCWSFWCCNQHHSGVLGHICYHILAAGLNGYMATITNLKSPSNKWRCGAAPITAMMTVKHYGRGLGLLRQNATRFLLDDGYRNPGPLQFDGPGWKQQSNILLGMSRKLILLVSKDGQERFTSL
ncbi:putative diphosphate--fructose-6-phosphate 1-phosphotransferase [Helianthus annuus]|nr:putative diphosphate--fructose-6-phosphate 1-phosphotransferase [Helianthus annuus]